MSGMVFPIPRMNLFIRPWKSDYELECYDHYSKDLKAGTQSLDVFLSNCGRPVFPWEGPNIGLWREFLNEDP